MPLPLSEDLRWRIVMLYQYRQYSISEIASFLVVSEKSVQRILTRFNNTAGVGATKQRHGPEVMLGSFGEMILVQFLMEHPGAYLDELQTELYQRVEKKLRHVVMKRSEESRGEFKEEMASVHADMIVWIDETGTDSRDCHRRCGYHIRGTTPVNHILNNTVDGDTFLHFVQNCLVPILQPFDGTNPRSVVVMDNASIHHIDRVIKAIYQTGAIVRFLPPYSPDLQPLEEVFSKVKSFLKRNEIVYNSSDTPSLIVTLAFTTVTTGDCINYIKHAEYHT
ncbi:uncharacterized protein [Dysidea avara]|uniref:uncharacterized protein n=1 Tax=Dysidea avara TaxID=196820 RepID=UPI00332E6CD5